MLIRPWQVVKAYSRYWDPTNDIVAAKISPGEFYVTDRNELITTVLGSCISACIRDSATGIGGMNHFMLPETTKSRLTSHDGKSLVKQRVTVILLWKI